MKIITQKDGKHTWVALRDDDGIYYCLIDGSHQSQSIYLAGHLYHKEDIPKIRKMLQKEGHK